MILQFCGLSGSGKTTLANAIREKLRVLNLPVEIIDGDEYRKVLCADLGFSREDRQTNIRRLAFVAAKLSAHGIISIICAINPYESVREEVRNNYPNVKTVFINCDLETLKIRDTKGLYQKALLPDGHPDKIYNLTGINDPFDFPRHPDLVLNTHKMEIPEATDLLLAFILQEIQ